MDRTVGARVSGQLALRYGDAGLPDGQIRVDLAGHATTLSIPLTDTVPPATVTTLRARWMTSTTVQLTWNAPGDSDFVGRADHYDVRYASSLFASQFPWSSATPGWFLLSLLSLNLSTRSYAIAIILGAGISVSKRRQTAAVPLDFQGMLGLRRIRLG